MKTYITLWLSTNKCLQNKIEMPYIHFLEAFIGIFKISAYVQLRSFFDKARTNLHLINTKFGHSRGFSVIGWSCLWYIICAVHIMGLIVVSKKAISISKEKSGKNRLRPCINPFTTGCLWKMYWNWQDNFVQFSVFAQL